MKTLIEKVRAINQEAADYLENEVAPRYEVTPGKIDRIKEGIAENIKKNKKAAKKEGDEYLATPNADLLSGLFLFETSPQYEKDPDFWNKILKQLGE